MTTIRVEAWYQEAESQEQLFSRMQKLVEQGDRDALHELGRLYLRTGKTPTFTPQQAASMLPVLVQIATMDEGLDWAVDLMWMASKACDILPNVPKELTNWIPVGAAPRIKYTKTWEVMTEGSSQAGDYEDLGWVTVDGGLLSSRGSHRGNQPPDSQITHEEDLDDFLTGLEYEYSDLWENGGLVRNLDREAAQGEFGDTYNEEAYGDEVDDYYGESLATVIGGKFEIYIENDQHREQIMRWVSE